MKHVFEKIRRIVEKELSSSAHSMEHVLRVHDLCIHLAAAESRESMERKRMGLAKDEPNADMEVLEAAVLLHDIARVREDEDNTGNIDHAVLGSALAEKALKDAGFPSEKIEKVKQCIIRHRFRSGSEPDTIEAKILFDADKLDILGTVGIARLFMVAGEYNEKIYADIPLDGYIKENFVGGKINGRIKDTSKHSPNLELYTKLIYIPEKLYTKKAKQIALERLEYMKGFFNRLKSEIYGT